jgi:hypothetical protein
VTATRRHQAAPHPPGDAETSREDRDIDGQVQPGPTRNHLPAAEQAHQAAALQQGDRRANRLAPGAGRRLHDTPPPRARSEVGDGHALVGLRQQSQDVALNPAKTSAHSTILVLDARRPWISTTLALQPLTQRDKKQRTETALNVYSVSSCAPEQHCLTSPAITLDKRHFRAMNQQYWFTDTLNKTLNNSMPSRRVE